MRWLFFGAGNMASSLIGGLRSSGCDAADILAIDIDAGMRERARTRYGIATHASLADKVDFILDRDDIGIVIAVKPQNVIDVCRATVETLPRSTDALVLSVAAGIRLQSLERWLHPGTPIVRVMPNTPALIGQGASGLFANAACNAKHREQAARLLERVGRAWWVDDEEQLDAVTAVAGSGPAYFFYLIEQMSRAGTQLGLDEETARAMAVETAHGAAAMARADDADAPATLRRKVTSPGGTTAAAIASFDKSDFPAMVEDALRAACRRSGELAREFGSDDHDRTTNEN